MDFIDSLGSLAFGSRLKRLSDRIMQDGTQIYSYAQLPFEPRWFPVYRFLAQHSKVSQARIARELGITHPSVHQTLSEMTRAKLVTSTRDPKDKRKRLVSLSKKGQALLPQIRPVWDDIRSAIDEVIAEAGVDVMEILEKMERSLEQEPFAQRFRRHHKQHQHDQVEIITYDPKYRAAFEELNRQWIEFYFHIEEEDLRTFAQPEKYVLAQGGQIFFAREIRTDRILGTVALTKHVDGDFELSKMGVHAEARGRQIGLRLAQAVLQAARDANLERIVLFTNSKLVPALGLYKKLGFVKAPMPEHCHYERSDIFMICPLAVREPAPKQPVETT